MNEISNAVQQIADLAVKANANCIHESESGHTLYINGETVISLEKFEKNRSASRGTFSTNNIKGFIEYVKLRGVIKENLFANDLTLKARAFFDGFYTDGKQGHCLDSAELKLNRTAAYQMLHNINGKRFNQAGIIELLVDWKTYLNDPKLIARFNQLKLKKVSESDSKITQISVARTASEEIAASAAGGDIPTEIVFNVVPFVGFGQYEFVVSVSLDPQSDTPVFVLRVQRFEELQEIIGSEFALIIETGLGCAPNIGEFTP